MGFYEYPHVSFDPSHFYLLPKIENKFTLNANLEIKSLKLAVVRDWSQIFNFELNSLIQEKNSSN